MNRGIEVSQELPFHSGMGMEGLIRRGFDCGGGVCEI